MDIIKGTEHQRNLPKEVATNETVVNLDYLNEISEGNVSFIEAMLQAFKDESVIFLNQMDACIEVYDFPAMAKCAHRMKPVGSYVGASALTVLLGNLEQAAIRTDKAEATSLFFDAKKLIKKIQSEIGLQQII